MASAPSFSISGLVSVDTKQAVAALNAFLAGVNNMAATATRMADVTDTAFKRADAATKVVSKGITDITKAATELSTSANKMADATEKALKRTETGAKKATGSVSDLSKAFSLLSIGALATQMQSFGDSMFSAADQTQGFRRALTAVTGSAKEANSVIKEMSGYADTTPFDTDKLTQIATKFGSMKQPIRENVELAAKLAFIFKKDLVNAGDIVGQANAGVIDSMQRLKEQYGFTAMEAQKYGAIVSRGQLIIGDKGSEANDRFMKSLRSFVADREKGLGGNIFSGDLGIGGALSNLRSGVFQALAGLGDKITPDIQAFADALRSLLDMFKKLPDSVQANIGRLAALFVVLVPLGAFLIPLISTLSTLISSVYALGVAWGGIAITATSVNAGIASVSTGLVASLGPWGLALAAVVALSAGIVAYKQHLEDVSAEITRASKIQAEYSTTANKAISKYGKQSGGKNITQATTKELQDLDLTSEESGALATKLLAEIAYIGNDKQNDMVSERRNWDRSPGAPEFLPPNAEQSKKIKQQDSEIRKRLDTIARLAKAQVETVISDFFAKKEASSDNIREFHQISAESDQLSQMRAMNSGLSTSKYAKRLEELKDESEKSLIKAQKATMVEYLNTTAGMTKKEALKAATYLLSSKDGTSQLSDRSKELKLSEDSTKKVSEIYSGEANNFDQMKALTNITKDLIEARKVLLETTIEQGRTEEKLNQIQHKSNPQTRMTQLHQEVSLIQQAMRDQTLTAEEGASKLRMLKVEKAQEIQQQIDAQKAANIDLKQLYGDDVTAKGLALAKRVQDMREAGISEITIEKQVSAEKQKIWSDEVVAKMAVEQQMADMKAALVAKNARTEQDKLNERIRRGDAGATDDLIASQTEQMQADLKKVDADAGRKKTVLKAQLKAEKNPSRRRALEAELGQLDAAARAEKEQIQQEVGSKTRDEYMSQQKYIGDRRISSEETDRDRLEMRRGSLMESASRPGADRESIARSVLDNLRQQLELNKDILKTKYEILIAEKSEDPVAQESLRKELKTKTLEAERAVFETAKNATAELEKQNAAQDALNAKKRSADPRYNADNGSSLGSSLDFSGFSNFGEGFGKGIYKADARNLNTSLGIDPNNRRDALTDAATATNLNKRTNSADAWQGTPLTDKRNAEIMNMDKSTVKVEGAATLKIQIEQDGKTKNVTSSIPMNRVPSTKNIAAPTGGP